MTPVFGVYGSLQAFCTRLFIGFSVMDKLSIHYARRRGHAHTSKQAHHITQICSQLWTFWTHDLTCVGVTNSLVVRRPTTTIIARSPALRCQVVGYMLSQSLVPTVAHMWLLFVYYRSFEEAGAIFCWYK